ncbi:MAG: bifunctional phosphoribosyl-AMP cyclohydrolase/phosphoribosyl-ATP diphosphatase HisIE [Chloroflexota bacterium]
MIKLDGRGLVPAIVQDANTGQVLMLGYMNPGSIKRTLEGGQVWFYSRSREELWQKGETSGNYLDFKEAYVDCDGDTLLLKVEPTGPTCHTGNQSCFFQPVDREQEYQREDKGSGILEELFSVIQQRKLDRPEGSYTVRLLEGGVERIAQKVIEEAGEAALAGATMNRENLPKEVADLLYHALVLLSALEVSPEEVWKELRQRRG